MEKFISFGQENEKLYMCITNMLSGEFDDYNTVTTLLDIVHVATAVLFDEHDNVPPLGLLVTSNVPVSGYL